MPGDLVVAATCDTTVLGGFACNLCIKLYPFFSLLVGVAVCTVCRCRSLYRLYLFALLLFSSVYTIQPNPVGVTNGMPMSRALRVIPTIVTNTRTKNSHQDISRPSSRNHFRCCSCHPPPSPPSWPTSVPLDSTGRGSDRLLPIDNHCFGPATLSGPKAMEHTFGGKYKIEEVIANGGCGTLLVLWVSDIRP